MREFSYAVECLESIVKAWEQGKRVTVHVVDASAEQGDDEFTECENDKPLDYHISSYTSAAYDDDQDSEPSLVDYDHSEDFNNDYVQSHDYSPIKEVSNELNEDSSAYNENKRTSIGCGHVKKKCSYYRKGKDSDDLTHTAKDSNDQNQNDTNKESHVYSHVKKDSCVHSDTSDSNDHKKDSSQVRKGFKKESAQVKKDSNQVKNFSQVNKDSSHVKKDYSQVKEETGQDSSIVEKDCSQVMRDSDRIRIDSTNSIVMLDSNGHSNDKNDSRSHVRNASSLYRRAKQSSNNHNCAEGDSQFHKMNNDNQKMQSSDCVLINDDFGDPKNDSTAAEFNSECTDIEEGPKSIDTGSYKTINDKNTMDLESIKLPPKIKKRGRPKGADLTVIGLPRKKKCIKKPVKFLKKPRQERDKLILSWILPDDLVERAILGEKIGHKEIVSQAQLSPSLLDDNVNWASVQHFFTKPAWTKVSNMMTELEKTPGWKCGACHQDLLSASIVCEACLVWYHLKCSGLHAVPKRTEWFCRLCFAACSIDATCSAGATKSDTFGNNDTDAFKDITSTPHNHKMDSGKQTRPRRRKRKLINESSHTHDVVQRYTRLVHEVKAGEKLGDDHINAVNQLLRGQFGDFQGLSTPVLGQGLAFQKFDFLAGFAGFGYYQILHTGADHWMTVKLVSDHEAEVYDSVFLRPNYITLKQISSIAQCKSSTIQLNLNKVQVQRNSVDCGVYAIAYLTDLCHGKDPASCKYAGAVELRDHLISCFENGRMSPFPSSDIVKEKALIQQFQVYCSCRLPRAIDHVKNPPPEEAVIMIQCHICDNLYHHSCVGITKEKARRMNANPRNMWFCDYRGCEEAFGDVFESD